MIHFACIGVAPPRAGSNPNAGKMDQFDLTKDSVAGLKSSGNFTTLAESVNYEYLYS